MPDYCCLFLASSGVPAARREFHAENDEEAVIVARAFYAERATRGGLELWQMERRVYGEDEAQPLVAG